MFCEVPPTCNVGDSETESKKPVTIKQIAKKIRYVALYSKLHHNSPLFDDVNFNIQKVVKFFIITIIILSSIKAHINKKANTQMTILKENRNMVPYNH